MRPSNTFVFALLCLIGILYPIDTFAQYLQPSFKNYTVDDGLPSSEVHVAIQDNDGYMWFGTDNGLSRFDGYEFTNFGAEEGLLNPVIFDLEIDDNGRLWILTMSGNIYVYDNSIITAYKHNNKITKFNKEYTYATGFHVDKQFKVIIGLYNKGILEVTPNGQHQFINDMSGKIYASILDIDSDIIYATSPSEDNNKLNDNLTISIINDYGGSLINFKDNEKSNKEISFSAISIEKHNYIINLDGLSYNINSTKTNDKIPLEFNKASAGLTLKDGTNWIGYGQRNGLFRIDYSKEHFILSGHSISDIYEDVYNNVWVSTINNGIFLLTNSELLDLNSFFLSGQQDIRSIAIKSNSELYFGSWNGSVYSLKAADSRPIKFSQPNLGSYNNYDYGNLYYSQPNELLIGGSHLSYWKNASKLFITHTLDLPPRIHIKSIGSQTHNNKLLANATFSTLEIDLSRQAVISNSRNLQHDNIRRTSCNYDNNGNRWIGKTNGLWHWGRDSIVRPPNMSPFLKERIEAIEFLSNGQFVLGTKGRGVIIWDQKEIVHQITTEQGLTSNMIENIFIDSLDQVWVGTLNGLNRIRINDQSAITVKQFSKKHGLPGNEINKVRRQGEHIWVATTTGLGRIKDEEPNTDSRTPIFSSVTLNGNPINISSFNKFKYDENHIQFEFVALNYKSQGDINYRYRLHSNNTWQETKTRILNFPDLSPSSYTLEIQAQNEDGYWSESATQHFTINPPLWQRWWFITIACLMVLGIGTWYIKRRQNEVIRTIKNEHSIKSQIVELERSALQAQMNPHFIFNILNSIQLAINENKKEHASQTLSKFAKLIRATLKNAKTSTITLEEEINYIESYLYLEQIRFKKEAFQYEVVCSPNIDQFETQIPPMLVQPFVENAIKHGIVDNNMAVVRVGYDIDVNHVVVKVRDNGSGFNNTRKPDHESFGMGITQRRLELLNQGADVSDIFKINQLKDDNNQTIGTEIVIKVKIN